MSPGQSVKLAVFPTEMQKFLTVENLRKISWKPKQSRRAGNPGGLAGNSSSKKIFKLSVKTENELRRKGSYESMIILLITITNNYQLKSIFINRKMNKVSNISRK